MKIRYRLLASPLLLCAVILSDANATGPDKRDTLTTDSGFNAEAGAALWKRSFTTKNSAAESRSCISCHTPDPKREGKHIKTGKAIAPMAPSVNPQRLTNRKKMEKWFKRNCQWTLGRLCTPRERGELLTFLKGQ